MDAPMGPPMVLSISLLQHGQRLGLGGGHLFSLDRGTLTINLGGDFRGVYLLLGLNSLDIRVFLSGFFSVTVT